MNRALTINKTPANAASTPTDTQSAISDFTKGSLSRHLVFLALPLIFGNILQEFYNTIDAFVVGRFAGQNEFAAIGIAGTVMNLFLFALVGCCTGFSVLFARAYGQRDMKELRRQYVSALTAGLSCTFILIIIGLACMHFLLNALQTPAELTSYVTVYLRWILVSLPAAFMYNLYASLLRASGDTKAALIVLAAAVVTNLVLDIIFVAYLELGIMGAAAATAITQFISAILCKIYICATHRELLLHQDDFHVSLCSLATSLRFGIVSSLHQCSLYLGKMLVQGTVNSAGTEIIAAYTAATRIEGFANSIGSSGSTSTSILTAQNYGAGNTKRVEKGFFCSLTWLAALGSICGLIMLIFAPQAIHLMLGTGEGIAFNSAVHYLRLVSLFYIFCFTGGTFTGYFGGIGKVMYPFAGTMLHISFRVIASWFAFRYLGLNAVALATGTGWMIANLLWCVLKIRRSTKLAE